MGLVPPFTLFGREAAEAPQERAARPAPRVDPNEGRYRVLAEFVAKRYRVSQDVTLDWVKFAHKAGHALSLDPLLIIAVIATGNRAHDQASQHQQCSCARLHKQSLLG